MTKKKFLDSIDVKSPCNESWDEMFGNDEVRFCSHCAKNVHNLSAMTRQKAEDLISKSEGKLCVRYIKTPEGKLLTAPPPLTKITRRAAIAASVLATSLTLSTMAYSQGEPLVKKDKSTQTQKDATNKNDSRQGLATISGTVLDELNAVIPKATVVLNDKKSGRILKTQTNDEGIYEFKNVEIGIYQIESFATGFATTNLKDVEVKQSSFKKDITLSVGELMGEVIFIEVSRSILGTIKDRSDGVIPNAKITLRDTKTGKTLQTKSKANGSYDFIDFEPSVYELTVESDGYKKLFMQNIEISKDTKVEKNLILEVGEPTIYILPDPDIKQTENNVSSVNNSKQQFSIISGTIKDERFLEIPNATIRLRNTKNGKTIETKTNSKGFYEFMNIKPSIYEIKIWGLGFESIILKDINISENTKLEKNVVLRAGMIGEVITVETPSKSKPKKKKN